MWNIGNEGLPFVSENLFVRHPKISCLKHKLKMLQFVCTGGSVSFQNSLTRRIYSLLARERYEFFLYIIYRSQVGCSGMTKDATRSLAPSI